MKPLNLVIVAAAIVLIILGAKHAAERQFKNNCKQTCMVDSNPDSPASAYVVSRSKDGKLDCECVAHDPHPHAHHSRARRACDQIAAAEEGV